MNNEADSVTSSLARLEQTLARILWLLDRDELLTEKEAAALRRKTIYALRKERARRAGPPFIKDGNSVRYRKSELLAWLGQHTRESKDSERRPRFRSVAGRSEE